MDWQLKENLRLNKTCNTCNYGSETTNIINQVPLCLWYIENENDKHPTTSPSIKTCLKWECLK